jgi:hypothetical protein
MQDIIAKQLVPWTQEDWDIMLGLSRVGRIATLSDPGTDVTREYPEILFKAHERAGAFDRSTDWINHESDGHSYRLFFDSQANRYFLETAPTLTSDVPDLFDGVRGYLDWNEMLEERGGCLRCMAAFTEEIATLLNVSYDKVKEALK